MNQRNIDIIIVNYNSTDYLLKCLESIHQDINAGTVVRAHIFVFDNHSTDDPGQVTRHFPHVRLFESRRNIGFARAVNACLVQGNAPLVLILNPDVMVLKGFFQTTLVWMENNERVGVLGPRILNQDFTVQGSARAFPSLITSLFGRNSILTRIFPNNRITRKNILYTDIRQTAPVPVDWVSGACMMVRRRAIEEVGLLDERFFMYWEDADWCRRMGQKGWGVIYHPAVSVLHFVGGSSEKNLIQSVVEFHKSVYYFYKKYYSSSSWLTNAVILGSLAIRIGFVLVVHAVRRWRKTIRKKDA